MTALAYCIVFALLAAYGKPGLGIGQGFYLPIVLIALAAGPFTGAAAGLGAAILYASALDIVNESSAAGPSALSIAIRLACYVAVGAMIGYVAPDGGCWPSRSTCSMSSSFSPDARSKVAPCLPRV